MARPGRWLEGEPPPGRDQKQADPLSDRACASPRLQVGGQALDVLRSEELLQLGVDRVRVARLLSIRDVLISNYSRWNVTPNYLDVKIF
jgi:hypothetical protein